MSCLDRFMSEGICLVHCVRELCCDEVETCGELQRELTSQRSQTFVALSVCETLIEGDQGELRIARYRQPELWLSAYPTRHLEQMRLRRTSNDCHVGECLASRILSVNSSWFGMLEREVLLVVSGRKRGKR